MEEPNTRILFFGYDCTKDSVVFNATNFATLLYGFITMIVFIELSRDEVNWHVGIGLSVFYVVASVLGLAAIRNSSHGLLKIYLGAASLAVLVVGSLVMHCADKLTFWSAGLLVAASPHVCRETKLRSL